MAINAGVDMYMIGNVGDAPGPVQFIDTVVSLVEDGAIPIERIDEAVRRILELKADLGLFEQPTVDESRIETVLGDAQETAETMAKESMVLLNATDDTLPLSGDESVLLTGPGVDSNGNNTRALMQHGGWTLGWQGASAGGPFPRQNLLEANSALASAVSRTFPPRTSTPPGGPARATAGTSRATRTATSTLPPSSGHGSSRLDLNPMSSSSCSARERTTKSSVRDELVLDESQQGFSTPSSSPPRFVADHRRHAAGSPRGHQKRFGSLTPS